jgi:hypothetical protein
MKKILSFIIIICFLILPATAFSENLILTTKKDGTIRRLRTPDAQPVIHKVPTNFEEEVSAFSNEKTYIFVHAYNEGALRPRFPNCIGMRFDSDNADTQKLCCWPVSGHNNLLHFDPVSGKLLKVKKANVKYPWDSNDRSNFVYIEKGPVVILSDTLWRGGGISADNPDPNCGRHPITGELWCWR